jgi:SAM-dependent methyltransferase
MPLLRPPSPQPNRALASVNEFLRTEIEARALALAFSRGLIDALADGGGNFNAFSPQASQLLARLLTTANVVVRDGDRLRLSETFTQALAFRDLLEARLWFCNLVAPDVHQLFEQLLTDIPQFMARSKVFELFRYDRALEVTADNLAFTAQWVGYTTALTRYEAPAGLDRLELGGRGRLLDVGGNSGEFARQAVEAMPGLEAAVFDLPVVCELGRRHLAGTAGADRVSFIAGDLRGDGLPPGQDVVSFKSVLHDWPDRETRDFLRKAFEALAPGGMLVIFERGEIDVGDEPLPYWMVANLVFLPFFRKAEIYRGWLGELGFADIEMTGVELEMPFHLIVARKPE